MLLATAEDLKARLGLNDDAGVTLALEEALKGASVYIGTVLRTSLVKASHSDIFYVDPDVPTDKAGFLRCRLSHGFVRSKSAYFIAYESSYDAVVNATASAAGCVFDFERGYVLVPDTFKGKYVRVSYSAGFNEGEPVPEWLKEAAMGYASKVLSQQQIGDSRPEMAEVYKFVDNMTGDLLNAHLRNNKVCVNPIG